MRNSDGWMLTPISTIQRRAPLTSAPMNGVASTMTKLTMNTISAMRRIQRGDRSEVASSTAAAGTRYIMWRCTK